MDKALANLERQLVSSPDNTELKKQYDELRKRSGVLSQLLEKMKGSIKIDIASTTFFSEFGLIYGKSKTGINILFDWKGRIIYKNKAAKIRNIIARGQSSLDTYLWFTTKSVLYSLGYLDESARKHGSFTSFKRKNQVILFCNPASTKVYRLCPVYGLEEQGNIIYEGKKKIIRGTHNSSETYCTILDTETLESSKPFVIPQRIDCLSRRYTKVKVYCEQTCFWNVLDAKKMTFVFDQNLEARIEADIFILSNEKKNHLPPRDSNSPLI